MICLKSEEKYLTPFISCDVCGDPVKGEDWLWSLTPRNGLARIGDVFFSHDVCKSSFEAQNEAPPGWGWSRLHVQRFLELLATNTTSNPVTVLAGKGPRTH
jgi:superoxide dismutase